MNLIVVSSNYPDARNPSRGIFVYNLIQELVKQGINVSTIAPIPRWKFRPIAAQGSSLTDSSTVVRPKYLSLSNRKLFGEVSTARLGVANMTRSVLHAAKSLPRADVIYAHFLYPSGIAALRVGMALQLPVVVSLGESSMEWAELAYGKKLVIKALRSFDHIITVSEELKSYCTSEAGVPNSRITVIPNGVDESTFYPRNRRSMRQTLSLPPDVFVVISVGHFSDRKGTNRVLRALSLNADMYGVFIGSGPKQRVPKGEEVLFAGSLAHNEVPLWLAAADVFALPTLAEGSSNAIIEALAMGLPVVSSDIPAIREQVPSSAGILVKPLDIDGLAQALKFLKSNPRVRASMSQSAVELARTRSLSARARKVSELLRRLV